MPGYRDNPLCHVAESTIHGLGLFARQDIARNTWIGHYDGVETLENDTYVLWVEADEGEGVDGWIGHDGRNELRFMNHASEPNGVMDGLDLYAARDIRAGEEITINYGEAFENDISQA
jgi:SET domain-containing protein